MELHMHSHRWETRMPDLPAAAAAGFVGGALLMVLELLWSTNLIGSTPWEMSHMIAAILMGPDALASLNFEVGIVALALVVHYVLGIVFGMILAAIIAPFHLDSSPAMALLAGAVFGFVLYLLNFYALAGLFPWFAESRGSATLVAHLIFGMSTALMYRYLEGPRAAR